MANFTSTFTNLHTKLDVYPLLQILVTHFSANHIPQKRTTSSPARERTTHLVCGSYKRKLEHVETCLSTQLCLTQHPSDTLQLFQELNCRTMYYGKLNDVLIMIWMFFVCAHNFTVLHHFVCHQVLNHALAWFHVEKPEKH